MEWNSEIVEKLNMAFDEKYKAMFGAAVSVYTGRAIPTDRQNRTALWNKYIKNYDCKLIRNDVPGKKPIRSQEILSKNLIDLINFKNESVTNSVVIRNPDRIGQYILISRDMAERILAIGMI